MRAYFAANSAVERRKILLFVWFSAVTMKPLIFKGGNLKVEREGWAIFLKKKFCVDRFARVNVRRS